MQAKIMSYMHISFLFFKPAFKKIKNDKSKLIFPMYVQGVIHVREGIKERVEKEKGKEIR